MNRLALWDKMLISKSQHQKKKEKKNWADIGVDVAFERLPQYAPIFKFCITNLGSTQDEYFKLISECLIMLSK